MFRGCTLTRADNFPKINGTVVSHASSTGKNASRIAGSVPQAKSWGSSTYKEGLNFKSPQCIKGGILCLRKNTQASRYTNTDVKKVAHV